MFHEVYNGIGYSLQYFIALLVSQGSETFTGSPDSLKGFF
jgi:hypothetical protein